MPDFHRETVIHKLRKHAGQHELMNFLQTEMSPTLVSDCAVEIRDVPTADLEAALRALEGTFL